MEAHNLEYISQKEPLIIAEYGRNIQNLVNYLKTIEDDDKRQLLAEQIVHLMYSMNPTNKLNSDYKEKLWRHLFRIAKFELKVTPPNGIVPNPETTKLKPDVVEYPKWDRNYRHYGNHVKTMIEKAIEITDLEKQSQYVETIGAYMKLAYRTWSREHYVSDEIIKEDLIKLSKGKLKLSDDVSLDLLTSRIKIKSSSKHSRKNNSNKKKKYSYKNSNGKMRK